MRLALGGDVDCALLFGGLKGFLFTRFLFTGVKLRRFWLKLFGNIFELLKFERDKDRLIFERSKTNWHICFLFLTDFDLFETCSLLIGCFLSVQLAEQLDELVVACLKLFLISPLCESGQL